MANNFYQTLKKKLTLRWQSESHQTKLKNRIIQTLKHSSKSVWPSKLNSSNKKEETSNTRNKI